MPTAQTKSLFSVANHAHPGDVVFFNIDDTVLIPGIKKYKDMPEAMQEAVDALRLLEEKGVNVVFLTARHGDKEKIFSGTFRQLQDLGLKPKAPARFNFEHLEITFENSLHRYHDGVIFAKKMGEHEQKGDVLKQFLEQLPETPKRIWMIDDQLAELESIAHQDFEGLVDDPVPRLFQFLPHQSIFQGLNSELQTPHDAMDPESAGSASAPFMPESLEHMEVLDHLPGCSGGVFVLEDTTTGKKYTLKTADSEEQLSDEILLDRFYQLFGIPVPSFAVFDSMPGHLAKAINETPKRRVRLSEFIEADETLNTDKELTSNPHTLEQFAEAFPFDAACSNVDIAPTLKNIIVQKGTGRLYHVDNGCNLRNSARGGFRATSSIVDEIDTLRYSRVNEGHTLYENIEDSFIRQKITEALKRLPQILDELYNLNRILNIKGGAELIQHITDRIVYLKHRFCPDFPLKIPHHPADIYTSASTLIITPDKQGKLNVLVGQRAREPGWFGNLGGKSELEDEDLSTTAARETLEESADLIPLPDQGLKPFRYHDLLTHTHEGKPLLHRMYVVNYNKNIPLDELQEFASGRKRSRHVNEYTDFKQIPLKAIQKAVEKGPQEHVYNGTSLSVCLVELEDGTTISLHPPFAKMLAQSETKKHLNSLIKQSKTKTNPDSPTEQSETETHDSPVEQSETETSEPDQPPIMLKTPKEIAHDIAKQAVNKSQFLREFKQQVAPNLKERLEVHTRQDPEELQNEGPSGLHQAQPDYLSQTEIYLKAVLGEHFNPDPTYLEENVKYFLNEMSAFHDDKGFNNEENRQLMIDMILKEREAVAKGDVVFYHAAETSINFIIDFFTELRRQLFAEAREDFKAFRATDAFTEAFGHIDELIEHFSEGGKKGINNYESFFQELAISCNLFLLGNDGRPTSSSLFIFLKNESVTPPNLQDLLTQIMNTLELGETETQAVFQLFKKYQEQNRQGKLYQICVDKNSVDQTSYPAGQGGRHNPLEQETKLSQILNHLGDKPEQHQAYIKNLQARLLLNPKLTSDMHVNEFQLTNLQEDSSSQAPLTHEIKALTTLFAQKILTRNHTSQAFSKRSGIIEQTKNIRKELGIPVETQAPETQLVKAIYFKKGSLVLQILKNNPKLDLNHLPNLRISANRTKTSFANLLEGEKYFTYNEQTAFADTLLQHHKNFNTFLENTNNASWLLNHLPPDENIRFIETFKEQIIDAIKNHSDFCNVFPSLNVEAIKSEVFHKLMGNFSEFIKDTSMFCDVAKILDGSFREHFILQLESHSSELIAKDTDIGALLDALNTEAEYQILLEILGEKEFNIGPTLRGYESCLGALFSSKSPKSEQKDAFREILYQYYKPHFKDMIETCFNFKYVYNTLKLGEQRQALFQNLIETNLFKYLIKTSDDFGVIYKTLNTETEKMQYLQYFVTNNGIQNSWFFEKTYEVLENKEQKQYLFQSIIDPDLFKNMSQDGQRYPYDNFKLIYNALDTEEERKQYLQFFIAKDGMGSGLSFKHAYEALENEEKRQFLFKTLIESGIFKNLMKSGYDFVPIYKALESFEERKFVFEAFLEETKLSKTIKDSRAFRDVYNVLETSDERSDFFQTLLEKNELPSIITSNFPLFDITYGMLETSAQKDSLFQVLLEEDRLPNLIKNVQAFKTTCETLETEDKRNRFFQMCLNKNTFTTLIKNRRDFQSVYETLDSEEERDALFQEVKHSFENMINKASDYEYILDFLKDEAHKDAFQELMEDKVYNVIENKQDREALLEILASEDLLKTYDVSLETDKKILEIIPETSNFVDMYTKIQSEENKNRFFSLMIKRLPNLIHYEFNLFDIFTVLDLMSDPEKEAQTNNVFIQLKEKLPALLDVGDFDYMEIIVGYLQTEEQRTIFLEAMREKLHKIITTTSNFEQILQHMGDETSDMLFNIMPYQKIISFEETMNEASRSKLSNRAERLQETTVGKIIDALENYIHNPSQNKSPTFFSTTQTPNNQTEILLAETLRKELMPEGKPDASRLDRVFSEAFIMETRNRIIETQKFDRAPDYEPSEINSRKLNEIIQNVRKLENPGPSQFNPNP